MSRKQAIASIRVAGYHNDTKDFVRLYVENRVSYQAAQTAFSEGRNMRENGMRCDCFECRCAK